jgi:hypothetical protein
MDGLAQDALIDGFHNAAAVLREAANQLRISLAAEKAALRSPSQQLDDI